MRSWLKDSKVRQMSATEAAWLAGFFDGEGSLCEYKSGREGKYRSWRLTIPNTHKGSLDQCVAFTSVGSVRQKTRAIGNRQCSWEWPITAQREIVDICKQMLPYLVIKKPVVESFLAGWKDI